MSGERTALLEKAVLGAPPEEVRKLCGQFGVGDHSARALGLACRFRGLDTVKALIEGGASFRGVNREKYGGFMRITRWGAVNGEYYTARWEPSLMFLEPFRTIIVSGTELVGYSEEYGYINKAEDGGALSAEERLAVLNYLLGCGLDVGFDRDRVFYYSILTDCSEFYGALKARGAALSAKTREELINGGADWDAFSAILYFAPPDVFSRAVGRLAAELAPEEKIKYKNSFFEAHKNRFTEPKNLELILNVFERSKINQTKTLKFLIDNDAAGCLAAAEKAGWLKSPKRRDELIKYSADNGSAECAAWLLDFKNRTADLAAERAKAEKKTRRELNADPCSLSELKKSFRFTKKKDGTLIITAYSGHLTSIAVPAKIGNDRVTEIGDWAFSPYQNRTREQTSEFRKTITRVTLPDGLKKIGESAFCGLISLESVNIPKTVRRIGEYAFSDCNALKSIIVPEGVRYIEANAFSIQNGRGALEYVELPGTLEYFRESCKWRRVYLFDSGHCPDLVVSVPRGPYVEEFCEHNEVKFVYREDK